MVQDTCCEKDKIKKPKGFWSGLLYGIIPHTGCILFLVFAVLGVTTATAFFKPLLMSQYFFYGLIVLSFIFATISAVIYLKKHCLLSLKGIKQKKMYLSVLYGTSLGINLLLFLFIFPIAANMTGASTVVTGESIERITLDVAIPCPGHAPLISTALNELSGVVSVIFSFPKTFDVQYDTTQISVKDILALDVFVPYPATLEQGEINEVKGCSTCNECDGSCGGGSCS